MHTHIFTFGVLLPEIVKFIPTLGSANLMHVNCLFVYFTCSIIYFIDNYHQLDHNAQVTVFGFMNVLVTKLQAVTYDHSSSDSSSTLIKAQQQSINFQQQPTG